MNRISKTIEGLLLVIAVALSALAIIPHPAFAIGSFTYSMTCKDAGGTTYWSWSENGVAIISGTYACGQSGTGTPPLNANGFTATLSTACGVTKTVSKPFDPAKSFGVNLSANGSCTHTICFEPNKCFHFHFKGSAAFGLDYSP